MHPVNDRIEDKLERLMAHDEISAEGFAQDFLFLHDSQIPELLRLERDIETVLGAYEDVTLPAE